MITENLENYTKSHVRHLSTDILRQTPYFKILIRVMFQGGHMVYGIIFNAVVTNVEHKGKGSFTFNVLAF